MGHAGSKTSTGARSDKHPRTAQAVFCGPPALLQDGQFAETITNSAETGLSMTPRSLSRLEELYGSGRGDTGRRT